MVKNKYLIALYFLGLNLFGIGMAMTDGINILFKINGLGTIIFTVALVMSQFIKEEL